MSTESADLIRAAIFELTGLLTGGAGIRYAIEQAEKKAAERPRKKTHDLMAINAGKAPGDVCAALHRVTETLTMANIAAAEPGDEILTDSRCIRDMAFIRAAHDQHHDSGICEVDFPKARHAPAFVSAADDIEESGGAYVKAWVWIDTESVTSQHVADAAKDLEGEA